MDAGYVVVAGIPRMRAPVLETPIMDFRLLEGAPFAAAMVRSAACPNDECGRFRYRFIPSARLQRFTIACLFCGLAFMVS